MFDQKKIRTERAKLAASMPFNRRQRRIGAFVITDSKGRLGVFDTKRMGCEFTHTPLELAKFYTFENVLTIWQLLGMKPDHEIRMLYKHPKTGIMLV